MKTFITALCLLATLSSTGFARPAFDGLQPLRDCPIFLELRLRADIAEAQAAVDEAAEELRSCGGVQNPECWPEAQRLAHALGDLTDAEDAYVEAGCGM